MADYYSNPTITTACTGRVARKVAIIEQSIKFDLSLKDITKDPTAYIPIKEAISQISEISVKIPLKDDKGKGYHISTSLITALIPDEADYKSVISIKIERTIAEYLVNIPKGKKGAEQYTRYMLEVALNASSSYTIRIYLYRPGKRKVGLECLIKSLDHYWPSSQTHTVNTVILRGKC